MSSQAVTSPLSQSTHTERPIYTDLNEDKENYKEAVIIGIAVITFLTLGLLIIALNAPGILHGLGKVKGGILLGALTLKTVAVAAYVFGRACFPCEDKENNKGAVIKGIAGITFLALSLLIIALIAPGILHGLGKVTGGILLGTLTLKTVAVAAYVFGGACFRCKD